MEVETLKKYNQHFGKESPKKSKKNGENEVTPELISNLQVYFFQLLYEEKEKIKNEENSEKIVETIENTEEIELKGPTGLTGPTGYKERKEIKASFANNQINKILKDFFGRKIFFIPAALVSLLTFGSYFLFYFRKK